MVLDASKGKTVRSSKLAAAVNVKTLSVRTTVRGNALQLCGVKGLPLLRSYYDERGSGSSHGLRTFEGRAGRQFAPMVYGGSSARTFNVDYFCADRYEMLYNFGIRGSAPLLQVDMIPVPRSMTAAWNV
jgi:hypothetical protein